jgi:Tfp pilus assembly protein PilF
MKNRRELRLVLFLTSAVLCAQAVGCRSLSPESDAASDVAQVRKKHRSEMVKRYESNRNRALLEAALSRHERGDESGCLQALDQLLERSPNHRQARLLLAEVQLLADDHTAARQNVGMLIAADGDDHEALHAMGIVQESSGDATGALHYFGRAAALQPNNETYALSYSTMLESADQYVPSQPSPQKSLVSQPTARAATAVHIAQAELPPPSEDQDAKNLAARLSHVAHSPGSEARRTTHPSATSKPKTQPEAESPRRPSSLARFAFDLAEIPNPPSPETDLPFEMAQVDLSAPPSVEHSEPVATEALPIRRMIDDPHVALESVDASPSPIAMARPNTSPPARRAVDDPHADPGGMGPPPSRADSDTPTSNTPARRAMRTLDNILPTAASEPRTPKPNLVAAMKSVIAPISDPQPIAPQRQTQPGSQIRASLERLSGAVKATAEVPAGCSGCADSTRQVHRTAASIEISDRRRPTTPDRRILDADLETPQAANRAALRSLQAGQSREAEAFVRQAMRRHPESAVVHRTAGLVFYRSGDFSASEVALRKALSLDNHDPLAYFLLGFSLEKLGRPDAAQHQFAEAVRRDPTLSRR